MTTLSVDVGIKHLGFCIRRPVAGTDEWQWEGGYEVIKGKTVVEKVKWLRDWAMTIAPVDTFIVEKQVPQNKEALQIMWSLLSIFSLLTEDIVIFDPKDKFKYFGDECMHEYRLRKKWAVVKAKKYAPPTIQTALDDKTKKDDIADAFLQLFCHHHLPRDESD